VRGYTARRSVDGGQVYLVGAGPGDPGLLTLRGAEILHAAEAVLHDRLVSPGVLALAAPGAELLDVGHRAGEPPPDPDRVAEAMAALASRTGGLPPQGRRPVRVRARR